MKMALSVSFKFRKDGKELGPLSALNITGTYQVGVDPAIMGVGLAIAIPTAIKAVGLELDDIDVFEINEAFASQFVYCHKKLDLDPEKINVNRGAMAIGHPLGAIENVTRDGQILD
ncbi:hypothetical protein SLEP1_g46816 [Rubroshorea leprosula]|uniref:Thiolase C-terminal domain-containing protein n=1 Tax=Rubroshorea leprosula TaxID=152421 RepID=A0AAV5LPC4_9ROSI|nr:hypothetical protein SLEP1_g46816 [Rubroshorea leprosula]